ncbi:MAG: type IV pilus secretin PilQ [Desulfobacteraceae bacterium]|nr:type IV pilus secretin PilQ [Desulfobacteraceae bacterium]
MPFFQCDKKNHRIILVILTLFFMAGCTARKAENFNTPQKNEIQLQSDRMSDSSLSSEEKNVPKYIQSIQAIKEDKTVEILIQGNQKLVYTSIKQPFPFAICVYFPETKINPGVIPGQIEDRRIGGLKLGYADKKQTTAKLEILLNRDISYEVREDGEQLRVILLPELLRDENDDPLFSKGMTTLPENAGTMDNKISAPLSLVVPDTPALMTGIEFNTASSGMSDIRVGTNHPIRYDTSWQNDQKLNLNLYNTTIPIIHKRPLLTRYFNCAVESIEPKTSSIDPKNSIIEINVRERVPFQIFQDKNIITMAFEPSQVEAPPFNKGQKNLSGSMVENNITPGIFPVGNGAEKNGTPTQSQESLIPGESPPQYTGEKIKLDFYDTDIKNVFRILRSVSGLNFAIDKDVQGKVTMTLGNPVPWDQVMDLVLKMNNLGKKSEGNVIRIATIATLQNEEKDLQDAIAAKKKTLEERKSLEPLMTEYIPVNYSDALVDISPHIEQILSEDRGKISVDKRTNMIILTDTQEKIDQALEIIYRLDTVTPQIMIEAKVVEVTKEFAQSIGVGWNLSNDSEITSDFVDDFNISINPATTGGGLSSAFSFFSLFGSSVTALNAQLEASEELGDIRIVSSPRILTLDNKTARIKQGLEYAYLERDDSGGSSVSYKDIDLLLEVTPHVTPDNRISMTVFLTKNDIAGFTQSGLDEVPNLATNEAQTELLVNNNETVVIGGVVKTTKNDSSNGIPFLAGIPILGVLFGTETKIDNRNELLIFLTPSIVQLEQKRPEKKVAPQ